jgi:hypothetical protein
MKLYYKVRNKLTGIFSKPVEPPSYETKRATLNAYREKFGLNVLVETGTFMGDTVEAFKHTFDQVISIELAEELARKAKKRFENDRNVTIIQGDSGKVLKDILRDSAGSILFWLDGHYSSEFFVGEEFIRTGRTDVDTPVEEELRTILASKEPHVILIDDARLFTGVGDYPAIPRVRQMVKNSGKPYDVRVENDIIRITPRS